MLPNPDASVLADWKNQSVTSADATYNWPNTAAMNIFCKEPTNNAAPQGVYIGEKIHQTQTVANYSMYLMTGCAASESTWNGVHQPTGMSGLDLVDDWSNAECVPRP